MGLQQPAQAQNAVNKPVTPAQYTPPVYTANIQQQPVNLSINRLKQQYESEHSGPKTQSAVVKRSRPIDSNTLVAAWREYSGMVANTQPQLTSMLNSIVPTVVGTEVQVAVASEFIASSFVAEAKDLLTFLQNKLENDYITIKPIVSADKVEQVIYTSKQKLEKMIEKNTDVKTLIQVLRLDLE